MGLRDEPEITFSACFGEPFMVHPPNYYAALLKRKIERHGVRCWLVNTGWVGGPYGIGKRISIGHTRALLSAALKGQPEGVPSRRDPVFGFEVPTNCPNVPDDVLDPSRSWSSKEDYDKKYSQLAARFVANFRKFGEGIPATVLEAGPRALR